MTRRIVLCADDYGQAPEISQGILNLIEQNRLSATSCLVNSPHWFTSAKALRNHLHQIDIGLHFNLTEGTPLSAPFLRKYGKKLPSLSTLMRLCILRQFDTEAIRAELLAQLDCFVQTLGFHPRFIDGHQHVHQFPVIRTTLIDVYLQQLKPHQSYVRLASPPLYFQDLFSNFKKWIIYMMGASALKKLLKQEKIPHNESFTGIYPFQKAKKYSFFFPLFLKEIQHHGIIMCHPGFAAAPDDAIAQARMFEYEYLMSDQFISDCKEAGISIGKLPLPIVNKNKTVQERL